MATNFVISDTKTLANHIAFVGNLNLAFKWDIAVKRHAEKRTLSQNALYHQWIDIIREDQGNDHDDQGQIMMKHLIGPTHERKLPDGTKEDAWSTTRLSVGGMSNYMDALSRFCATDLGLNLPHPEDMQRRG